MCLKNNKKVFLHVKTGKAELVESYYSPEFGKRIKSECLRITLENKRSIIKINWSSIE
jgi:hypothetical protein